MYSRGRSTNWKAVGVDVLVAPSSAIITYSYFEYSAGNSRENPKVT